MSTPPERLRVLFEDEAIFVVDKPAGYPIHPGPGTSGITMVDLVADRIPGIRREEKGPGAGFVHRLDRDTTGVLLAAKDAHSFAALARQITTRTMEKRYLAVVRGRFHDDSGTIDRPLGLARGGGKRMTTRPDGKPSMTLWRRLEEFPRATFVEIELRTGRTHQIRAHFASVGHPLVGDRNYGGSPPRSRTFHPHDRLLAAFPRPALHAAFLAFDHPRTLRRLSVESPLADDVDELLRELRSASIPAA